MAKILKMTIQVNLYCLLHVSQKFNIKFTQIVIIKIFLDFTFFFKAALLAATLLFYSWAVLD